MKNFPTRFYDILESFGKNRALVGYFRAIRTDLYRPEDLPHRQEKHDKMHKAFLNHSVRLLSEARLFFAPADLASRISQSRPSFVSRDMIHLPFKNIFIEFGSPIETGEERRYGIHLLDIANVPIYKDQEEADSGVLPTPTRTLLYFWYWRLRNKDDGNWRAWSDRVYLDGAGSLISVSEEGVRLANKMIPNVPEYVAACLEGLAFVMFLNSTNVAYEMRQAPRMERPRDKHWWRKEYEHGYEELTVKTIPKRIALSLKKNESGIERTTPYHVKGHFKVFSHCGHCGRRRAIRRFLRKETCFCGKNLETGEAKTKMFWWDDFCTGPDVAAKVALT